MFRFIISALCVFFVWSSNANENIPIAYANFGTFDFSSNITLVFKKDVRLNQDHVHSIKQMSERTHNKLGVKTAVSNRCFIKTSIPESETVDAVSVKRGAKYFVSSLLCEERNNGLIFNLSAQIILYEYDIVDLNCYFPFYEFRRCDEIRVSDMNNHLSSAPFKFVVD